ncbi:MAG: M23 family metallopeptidase [Patescibacteria group bacterium]
MILLGAGCGLKQTSETKNTTVEQQLTEEQDQAPINQPVVVFPIADYLNGRTKKVFGQYIEDRFTGFHTGDDVEVGSKPKGDIAVQAIAPGEIIYKKWTPGYGGLVVINHWVNDEKIKALYGHLNLISVKKNVGETVELSERLGLLGAAKSKDTDNERQHLHFGLYQGSDINVSGYVLKAEQLVNWMNPTDFFQSMGLLVSPVGETEYQLGKIVGADDFNLSFRYPAWWSIEYVPQLKALNIFSLSGNGASRERSQIFIRFFDSDDFLTLETVDILDQQAGSYNDYLSITYRIVKKADVPDFANQPAWRNKEHRVTDLRVSDGFSRFYVIAQNPELPDEQFEQFLNSISFPD